MPSLDSIVTANTTRQTTFPTRKGFGVPMFLALHTFWVDVLRSFETLDELTAASVPSHHPIYKAAQAAFAQNPRPKKIVIGKRGTSYTQIIELTVLSAVAGTVYTLDVTDAAGLKTTITRTVPGASTVNAEATAIAALINALSDVAAAAVGAVITCTSDAGDFVAYDNLPSLEIMTVKDVTVDPGLATDLAAIGVATEALGESVSWYGMSLDRGSEAEINAAAAWCEARENVFIARSSDSIVPTSSSVDVASDLQAAAYNKTTLLYARGSLADFRDAAALGRVLAKEPGAFTLAHKTLAGITRDVMTSSQENYVLAKNGTSYTRTNGINILFEGKTGSGGFLDTTIFLAWVRARLQENIFGYLASQDVVPYTQAGIDALLGVVRATLFAGTKNPNPGFAASPAPEVDAIFVEDVDASDKATRRLTGITWRATLAGAIHGATVTGTVTL